MRRVVLVLWCVATFACSKSSVVAPAPVPTSPSATVPVTVLTISALIVIDEKGYATASTAIEGLVGSGVPPQSVSFTLSVKTGVSDSVKDVLVEWGDGETADLGAVSQAAASHSFSTAGTFVENE